MQKPVNSAFYGLLGLCWTLIGREDRIRTCDPYVPNVMRYRAALLPETGKTKSTADRAFDHLAQWPGVLFR